MAEFELIERIRARCTVVREDVRLGIGDDAALLAVPLGHALAVSTDTLIEGVHFPQGTKAFDVGWKALAVNLSDLAAMGATPAWATLALTLPDADAVWVDAFADGFTALAGEFKLALVGGDTTRGPRSITIAVHGFVPEPLALRRDAARVGDALFVTGTLGDAAAGLRCHASPSAESKGQTFLLERLNRPTPRVAAGLVLRGRAHACIDVSDGLVADLDHICKASGVGAAIDVESLPASPALLAFDDERRHELQLAGGDDYELCFSASEGAAPSLLADLARSGCGATRIGRIVGGSGVLVHDANGVQIALPRRGWEHFA